MQLHMTPDCFSPSQRKELRAAGWKAGWQLFACVQPGRGAEEGSGERKERRSFVWSGEVKVKWISRVFKEEVWTESCWQTGPQRRTHTHCSGMLVRILLYYFFFKLCHDRESFFVILEVFLAAPGSLSLCFLSAVSPLLPLCLSPSLTYYF